MASLGHCIIPDDAVDQRKLGFLQDFYSSLRSHLNFYHCYATEGQHSMIMGIVL